MNNPEPSLPRISVQVSGMPRFCAETDRLIACWQNYRQVDWYVTLNSQPAQTMTDLDPEWYTLTEDELAQEFSERLPENHRLRLMTWVNTDLGPRCPLEGPGFYSNIQGSWRAYKLAQHVNLLRRFLSHGESPYDLVVRARLDAAPDSLIDSRTASEQARNYPRCVAVSARERQGAFEFNDHLIWGSETAMNQVADAVDQWQEAEAQGIPPNPEVLTAWALRMSNISWPPTDWNTTLKTQGTYTDLGVFVPDLGTWVLPQNNTTDKDE